MNYLAHLILAGDNPQHLVGHMLADFVAAREIAAYPQEIRAGIRMHQRVDAFSDSHEAFNQSRRRFQPPYRRYAGILVDLAYDHFLARHWTDYSPRVALGDFTHHAYGVLHAHHECLPASLRRVLRYMSEDDWLSSYRELESIGYALRGISRRFRFANPLAEGIDSITENYDGLESDFLRFFPEMMTFAANLAREENAAGPSAGDLAATLPRSFTAAT